MTEQDFRAAVFGEVRDWAATAFPTLPVIYENGPVPDEDKIGPVWLDVEIRWYGGSISSVGTNPRQRATGAVSLMCYYKPGEGTDVPDRVIGSVGDLLSARRLGAAVLAAKQRTVPTNLLGWYKVGVMIPFTLG